MPDKGSRPFPIQLEVEFLDRLSEPVREGRAKSVSEIIRTALERYDFANMIVMRPSMLQISVRLAAPIRQNLKRISRTKHASVGQLVRAAVEAYLPQLETGATAQLEIPAVPPVTAAESVLAPPPKRKRKLKRKAPLKGRKPAAVAKKPATKRPKKR
jgi:Arc/MetJ-type ribon-helix-helix transcriptional regulator